MGDYIHRAIWYLRCKKGIRISRAVERYIVEELEEDLFPYGFDDGSEESVLKYVLDFVLDVHAGKININKSLDERILERYNTLKEEHLYLLAERNRYKYGPAEEEWDEGRPF